MAFPWNRKGYRNSVKRDEGGTKNRGKEDAENVKRQVETEIKRERERERPKREKEQGKGENDTHRARGGSH